MQKRLAFLFIIILALFFLVCFCGKVNHENDVDDLLSPFFSYEYEEKVFDERLLADLFILQYRSSWAGDYSSPLLFYWYSVCRNLNAAKYRRNFSIVVYDSLVNHCLDTIASADFLYEMGKVYCVNIKTKDYSSSYQYKYEERGKIIEVVYEKNPSIFYWKNEYFSSPIREVRKDNKDSVEKIAFGYYRDSMIVINKNMCRIKRENNKVTNARCSLNDSLKYYYSLNFSEDGRLEKAFVKKNFFEELASVTRRIEKNNLIYEKKENSEWVWEKRIKRNDNRFENIELFVREKIKNSIDTIQIFSFESVDSIYASYSQPLTRVIHLTQGDEKKDIFLDKKENVLGWILECNGVVREMAIILSASVFGKDAEGFRVVKFVDR